MYRSSLHYFNFNKDNEAVGKVLLTNETNVFGGHLTPPRHEIVDRGAFYEVTFFCISPKNLLGNFFYSLNDLGQRWLEAIRWSDLLIEEKRGRKKGDVGSKTT
jgi:hypothetical protein